MNIKENLAQAIKLHSQGNKVDAAKIYQEILSKQPNHAHATHYMGLIASENEQIELARNHLETSIRLQPNNPAFNHNIAGFYSRLGEIDLAVQHFNKAIELKPDYVEAYQGLSECSKMTSDSDIFEGLSQQLERKDLSDSDKNYLHFSAAKIQADSGNYDQAFYHYSLGNEHKKALFNVANYQAQIALIVKSLDNDFFVRRKDWGLYSHTPIFILGMPRSGTTLLEQILSSHSEVYGAGELNDISNIVKTLEAKLKKPYPLFMTDITFADAIGFGMEYLKRLGQLSNYSTYVVNKHPLNFKYIGLILLMFPNAKIIHSQRDPIDTCLSCYFQNFTKGQEYSFDLENLGHFYNGYHDVMLHWNKLFEGKIFNLDYENVVSDPETSIRALLSFCGIKWESSCMSFHQTERSVATASKYQVRQPLYASSMKRWKRYEKHLQPLMHVLKTT